MTTAIRAFQITLCLSLLAVTACGDDDDSSYGGGGTGGDGDAGDAGETTELDISVCDPDSDGFTLEIDNAYFPLAVGQVATFEGEEDGAALEVIITVLDETETVAGVETRVVEERESEDGELVEVSRNFFVQAADGTVCYFGEDVDDYEDGEIVAHSGAWRAGVDAALPGIIMPATPRLGDTYDQEVAEGIAEDHGEISEVDIDFEAGGQTYEDAIRIEETSPLDGNAVSIKVHAPGVGMIFDDGIELTSFVEP